MREFSEGFLNAPDVKAIFPQKYIRIWIRIYISMIKRSSINLFIMFVDKLIKTQIINNFIKTYKVNN